MSWDSYIDNLIGHSAENTDKACIIGLNGTCWTTSAHAKALKPSAVEISNIAAAFKSGNFTSFQSGGILLEGVLYQFLRADETIALGKKKDQGAITLQKSKTAIVIGHTKEGGQQGMTNIAVGVIADYLESLGM